MRHCQDLIQLFDECFGSPFNTRLIGGGIEPVYLPADDVKPYNRIVFSHDYFASALHEIAHWLLAGEKRRTLEDYGYWYAPDGRTTEQQQEFERVEVKPQALEWMLSRAADVPFRLSADNLNGGGQPSEQFAQAVLAQVWAFCRDGINARTASFVDVLCEFYNTDDPQRHELYRIDWLR